MNPEPGLRWPVMSRFHLEGRVTFLPLIITEPEPVKRPVVEEEEVLLFPD